MALQDYFSSIEDPRIDRKKLHSLEDILLLTIIAVVCGANTWVAIELYGKAKETVLRSKLKLLNGIPSHDTIERLFARIKPKVFEECFIRWVSSLATLGLGEIVSIDGKQLRRSHDKSKGKYAIHMVSAWANANSLVLGQLKVDDKSNEITAIPKLLELLDIEGAIITIDAMGCQKNVAEKIINEKADYVLALKGNQGGLEEQVQEIFKNTQVADVNETIEKDHGRIETRKCSIINDLKYLDDKEQWCELKSVVKIEATREIKNEITREVRYYISSLCIAASLMNKAIRSHWGIENSLHWVLDMVFREDESRKRIGNSAENFSIITRIALNLLKKENSVKLSLNNKRFKAALEEDYLWKVLKF